MISLAGRKQRSAWRGHRQRHLLGPTLARLCLLLGLLLGIGRVTAQIESTRLELATLDGDEVLLHVRVLSDQTIDSAQVALDDATLELEASLLALPETRWLLLDASAEMINLQSAVLSGVQDFVRDTRIPTGLMIYNSTVSTLSPTDQAVDLEEFLAGYTATADEPACLAQALTAIAEVERELDHSWRILVLTAADVSGQTRCDIQEMPALPAPIEMIAITDEVPQVLQDVSDLSGGTILRANLRTINARLDDMRSDWGQPTYALRAAWPDDWDASATLELTITLADGTTETLPVTLAEYNVPPPPEPTAPPATPTVNTETPRPTSTSDATPGAAAGQATVPTPQPTSGETPASGEDNLALVLIVGALLFIVGAVILAVVLSRVRRVPLAAPQATPPNFYDTLDEAEQVTVTPPKREEVGTPTRKATRASLVSSGTEAYMDETHLEGIDTGIEADDEVLITQVLSDERFKKMMAQSLVDDMDEAEIIAWMRLEGTSIGDFALTQRGAIIGRSQECDIQIRGDRAISRQHARLDVQVDNSVTISRLSAINPVVVGGVQVGNRHPLKPNDVIHLSDRTRLVFIAKGENAGGEVS